MIRQGHDRLDNGCGRISREFRLYRCEAAFQFSDLRDQGLHILTRGRRLGKHPNSSICERRGG